MNKQSSGPCGWKSSPAFCQNYCKVVKIWTARGQQVWWSCPSFPVQYRLFSDCTTSLHLLISLPLRIIKDFSSRPASPCPRSITGLSSWTAPSSLYRSYMSKKPDRHIQTAQSPPCVTACKGLECERFTEAAHEWTIRTLWETKTFELELKLQYSVRGSVVTAAPCQVVVRNMTVTRIVGASFGSHQTIWRWLPSLLSLIWPLILMLQLCYGYDLASYRKKN